MNILQFLREGLRFAAHAIRVHKTRSFLTMMGVATGIFAITGILTMVNSLQVSITDSFASLGNTVFFVHHWPWVDVGDDWYKYFNRPKASYNDFRKLKDKLGYVDGVAYEVGIRNQTVRWEGLSVEGASVAAVTPDFTVIKEPDLISGRIFSEMEHHLGTAVCIIGYDIATTLYPDQGAVGRLMRIGSKRFTVIGVMKRQGQSLFGPPSDDTKVYIPYAIAPRIYNLNRRGIEKVISIRASSHDRLDYVEQETIGIIRAARGLKPRAEDNFSINKQEVLMDQADKIFGVLETGGWFISLFSILIGGFSIGNIMYISVKERTPEIGIQKALGSTRSFILFQFLTEAILICLLGGLLGLGLVYGLATLAGLGLESSGMDFQIVMTMREVLIGLGLAVGIGVVSGILPAIAAARLDPVVAIRQN